MDDTACAYSANTTLQDGLDDVLIALSDLENLAYIQQLLLNERMQQSCERDALFTLHYALRDRLEALRETCGTLSEEFVSRPPARPPVCRSKGGSSGPQTAASRPVLLD